MENLPLEVQTHIFDYLVGDCVHWTNVYNNVIQHLNNYLYDINTDLVIIGSEYEYEDLFVYNILRYHL